MKTRHGKIARSSEALKRRKIIALGAPASRGFFSASRRKTVITYYHYPRFNPVRSRHFPGFICVHLCSLASPKSDEGGSVVKMLPFKKFRVNWRTTFRDSETANIQASIWWRAWEANSRKNPVTCPSVPFVDFCSISPSSVFCSQSV